MSQLLPSRDEEDRMWARLEQQRLMREAAARRVTPQGAQNLTTMQRTYPGLATGTKVSLAAAGVSPDDPVMAAVVQADTRVKKKKGFGWHTFGDIVSAGTHHLIGKPLQAAGNLLSPVGEAVGSVARPAVRTGMMALSAPLEEAQGLLRNVASGLPGRSGEITAGAGGGAAVGAAVGSVVPILGTAVGALAGGVIGGLAGAVAPEVEGTPQWGPQSQLGIAAARAARGETVDAGSGWFANAETGLGRMQKQRAIAAAGVRNKRGEITQGWTIGRSVADVVAEPGTTPYNLLSGVIDASAAIKLDPTAAALRGRTLSPTARGAAIRALKKDGLIDGARRTVLPEKVTEFLDHSEFGNTLKEVVAGEKSAYRISKMFSGQLDHRPDILAALADTDDIDQAAAILKPVLGADVAQVPKTELRRRRATRLIPGVTDDKALASRQTVEMPRRIEWDDPAGAIKALDAWQAVGKVPEAERLANNDAFIRALSGPVTGRLPALEAAAGSVKSVLVANGVDDQAARKMTQLFQSSIEDARLYTAGTIADGQLLPGMVVAGDGMALKSPFMVNEFLNHGVTLPDAREISDAVRLVKAFNHPLVKMPTELLDKAMYRWRQMAVLRPATTLRIAGDEQARLATAGYRGVTHPGQLIARIIADKKGNVVPDITGVPLFDAEVMQGALNRTRGSEVLKDAGVSMADRARLTVNDGSDLYTNGWLNHELTRLNTDPLGRQLARLRTTGRSVADEDELADIAEAVNRADDSVKLAVADATGSAPSYASVDEIKTSFWDGPLAKLRRDLQAMDTDAPVLASREASDAYVDQINTWLDDFTRNDTRLLEFVARGPRVKTLDGANTAMRELIEAGNHPAMVVGDRTLHGGADRKQVLDRLVDGMFDTFHARPTNFLARSQTAYQDYYRNVARMLPALDDADRAQIIRQAEQAKMPREIIDELKTRAKVVWDGERLSVEDVDEVAKIQAVENTKKLLYDVTAKSKWADATRLIFPFAEPWKESLTIWGKLLSENPGAVRRLDQTVQGARGSGFFQRDPQTGEEMFTYPGSAFISKMVVGAPIPIRGSAAGLNLFSSNPVMPGFGPMMQIAANQLVPDKPDFDWIRSAISPYGRPDTSGGFVESFLPAWAQKLRQAVTSGESDRLFNNTVYDMARYLVSTGDYSIDTPEAQEATSAAAVSMAKRMFLLRAGASFVSPSAPAVQAVAEDPDGRVVTQFALMEEYRALQQDEGVETEVNGHKIAGVGYDNAVAEFMARYGDTALLMMQPKTKGGGSPLDDTLDWARENPDLVKRYGDVYQYFAPHSGDFSQTAYERDIATGKRKALTWEEMTESANSRVASMLMRTARAKVGTRTSDAERRWLADVQAALIEEYSGYNPQSFDAGRIPAAIRQLEDAVSEPKMAESKNGQAIAIYLQARAKAQAQAEKLGVAGFQKAKAARSIRDWLRAMGAALTEETPEFGAVWDQLLSRELTSDIEATTSA